VVFDQRLAPTQVTIRTGGSVTWLNAGGSAHTVTSTDRSFRGFTLRPGGRRTVQFRGPDALGRHGFRVAGRLAGSVFVTRGVGRAVRAGTVYRYSVRTLGSSVHARSLLLRGVAGNLRSQYVVAGAFPNVQVSVRRVRGTVSVQTIGLPGGELSPRLQFVEASGTPCNLQPPPYPGFGGQVSIAGSSSARGGSVGISVQMTPSQRFGYDALLRQQRAAGCPANPRVNDGRLRTGDGGMFAGLAGSGTQGMTMSFHGQRLSAKRKWAGRGLAFPLAQLAAGRSFGASATLSRVSPRGNDRYDESIRVTFTRLR
jgi:hypothetical protein